MTSLEILWKFFLTSYNPCLANYEDAVMDDAERGLPGSMHHRVLTSSDPFENQLLESPTRPTVTPREDSQDEARSGCEFDHDTTPDLTMTGKSFDTVERVRRSLKRSICGTQGLQRVQGDLCDQFVRKQEARLQENTENKKEDDNSMALIKKSTRFDESFNTTFEFRLSNGLQEIEQQEEASAHTDYRSHYQYGAAITHTPPPSPVSPHTRDAQQFNFRGLGTSAAKPHVLTTAMIDALQDNVPPTKRGEKFWLKHTNSLEQIQRLRVHLLAVETMDGKVFGAFTAKPWHMTWEYYGTPESFLWRMRNSRPSKSQGRLEKAALESDLEIFLFSGNNEMVHLCKSDRLAVGGGSPEDVEEQTASPRKTVETSLQSPSKNRLTEWGFGLAFGGDLQQGTSSPCVTFDSPALSKAHSDGGLFEVSNLEIWTLTPCLNVEDANKIEQSKLTLEKCPTF